MNYWHSDWALSRAAALLGEADDAAKLEARSRRWTTLLDPVTGFFRPKDANGSFVGPFDEFAWGARPGFTEAGPWQYRFEVPYDAQGLKAALAKAGHDACELVQQANTIPPVFHLGGYGAEIHEQAEMSINCWSQWQLNNQPSWVMENIQVAFDSSVTGRCASQAQKWLRQSISQLLKAGKGMYPGDEDNGSMGAWFVMNMLGLYPLSPASGAYVLGSPSLGEVHLTIDGAAQPLVISASEQGADAVYVQRLSWNGAPLNGTQVEYHDLMQGGQLAFAMGPKPARA